MLQSIATHENGVRHKMAVDQQMKDARNKRLNDERAQRELAKELGDIDKVCP